MNRKLLKSKIHRATVTDANLQYEGSVTIDATLMEMAGILENEHVHIWDITNGARVETYVIGGKPGSGVVCINGAAAHCIEKGHRVIITNFAYFGDDEARTHRPKIIVVDGENRPVLRK